MTQQVQAQSCSGRRFGISQNAPFPSQSNPQLSLWRPETVATEVVGGDPGGGDQAPSSKWRPPQNGDIPSLTGHKIKTGFQGVQSGRDRRIEPRPLSPGGHLLLYGVVAGPHACGFIHYRTPSGGLRQIMICPFIPLGAGVGRFRGVGGGTPEYRGRMACSAEARRDPDGGGGDRGPKRCPPPHLYRC